MDLKITFGKQGDEMIVGLQQSMKENSGVEVLRAHQITPGFRYHKDIPA
jgi:hypothetical protein